MIYDRVFNVIGRAYTKCGFLSCTVSMLEVFLCSAEGNGFCFTKIPLKRFILYVTSKGKLCHDRHRITL